MRSELKTNRVPRRPRLISIAASALTLVLGSALCWASIEKLTLPQMVQRIDNAIYGEILSKQVTAVALPDGSGEVFFTTLTIKGTSILNGAQSTVEISYPGGFIDEENGVYNSEEPSADDVRLGNRVVAFYKWSADMGGGFASNALYASHGGLFRTFVSRKGQTIVQGRGTGYAVAANQLLTGLEKQAKDLYAKRKR